MNEGPYKLTRNPMYLGFTVLYVGITFVANAFWPLVFLPEAIVLTYLFAIRLEEAYLAREFGDAYRGVLLERAAMAVGCYAGARRGRRSRAASAPRRRRRSARASAPARRASE